MSSDCSPETYKEGFQLFFVWQEVGMPADFVNKLARMFQDIKVSEDLNGEFKEQHRNNNEGIAGLYWHIVT